MPPFRRDCFVACAPRKDNSVDKAKIQKTIQVALKGDALILTFLLVILHFHP